MDQTSLFTAALGLQHPWEVIDVQFSEQERRIDFEVAFERCLSTKLSEFSHATLSNSCSSARISLGGFSHTSVVGFQSLISPDHRSGFLSFAAS